MRAAVADPRAERPLTLVPDWPDPTPPSGWVTVRVRRAALNRLDAMHLAGRRDFEAPAVLGSDAAGVVESVGADVANVVPGQEVIILPTLWWGDDDAIQSPGCDILGYPLPGTHAELVAVPAENIFARPSRLSWDEAAALPMAGLTAWRALVARGRMVAGETVVVTAASSGVGSFAIQIAAAMGARVVAVTSSEEKADHAVALGAHETVLRNEADFAGRLQKVTGGADLLLESTGANWPELLSALRPGGRMVVIGRNVSDRGVVPVSMVFWRHLEILGSSMGSPRDFRSLLQHMAEASWAPMIDSVYRLDEIEAAYRRLDDPARFGKVLVDPTA